MNKHCEYCVNTPKKASYLIDGQKAICKSCIDSTFLQKLYNKWQGQSIQAIQSKQVNRYNLPIDHKYKVIGFDYCGSLLDGSGTQCENCNRLIVNTATVETEQGKQYTVGCDCAETLSLVDCSDFWKLKEQEALHRKLVSYIRTIKKQQEQGVKVSYSIDQYGAYIYFWASRQYRMNQEIYNQYFKPLNLPNHE